MADVIYPDWPKRPDSRSIVREQHMVRRKASCEKPMAVSQRFEDNRGANVSALLEKAIVAEIVPRLMLAHGKGPALPGYREDVMDQVSRGEAAFDPVESGQLEQLFDRVVKDDTDSLVNLIEASLMQGHRLSDIHMKLLAPAARHLGMLWETDDVTFVDVTLALGRLRQVVHQLRMRQPVRRVRDGSKRILLATAPGDQHSFGVSLLADIFHDAGWSAVEAVGESEAMLKARLSKSMFDVVGVSVSGEVSIDTVAPLLVDLRAASANKDIKILVGGNIFNEGYSGPISLVADRVLGVDQDPVAAATETLGIQRQVI